MKKILVLATTIFFAIGVSACALDYEAPNNTERPPQFISRGALRKYEALTRENPALPQVVPGYILNAVAQIDEDLFCVILPVSSGDGMYYFDGFELFIVDVNRGEVVQAFSLHSMN